MRNTTEGNTAFACPILIGDIGGTNARFSILVDTYAEPKSFPNVETADFVSIDEAIQTAVLDRTSMQPRTAILAVAGPIDGDEIDLTNCDWVVRPNEMIANLGFEDVIVINDFEAQALGVAFLEDAHLEKIGTGEIDENASRVVLGPGTGLGVAGLVNARRTWVPVPGEGGHVDLGPRSPRDFAIFPHIETIEGRVSAEQILCGRGIVNLYRAICRTDGVEPQFVKPSDITTAALDNSNREAVETVSLFSSYLWSRGRGSGVDLHGAGWRVFVRRNFSKGASGIA